MIRIYHLPHARSLRVVWLMEELGEAYELERVGLPLDAAFLAKSPQGTLPFIEDSDTGGAPIAMAESIAILQYITGRRLPEAMALTVGPRPDPAAYAAHLQFLHLGEASLTAMLAPIFGTRRRTPADEADNFTTRMCTDAFVRRLATVEARLGDGRDWLMGDAFTIADISVGYALGLAQHMALGDLLPKAVADYAARLQARPAYRRAVAK